MPPILATIVYVGAVVWLFRRDMRQQPRMTSAFWLPLIWFIICSTRFISQWLAIFGINTGGGSIEDGSPLDALVFLSLIIAGVVVLKRRQVRLSEVIRNNRYLAFFFAYCALSIAWSDFPFVAAKRLFKDLGHPIMVLVLLTEPDPEEAVIRLIKRCAYVCLPISILFIKYYPQLGRSYSEWTGGASYSGVTLGKNTLGLDCFILGAFLFWFFLKIWRTEKSKQRRNELILLAGLFVMIGWLFKMAQSSTSLVSLAIAVAMILFLGLRWVQPRYMGLYLVAAACLGIVAEGVFGIYTQFLLFLGKDPTLTDRTYIWKDLLAMKTNPLVGVGFESFWLGDDRLRPLWEKWHWHPNEAHNGYLETYLDLGMIGVLLLLGMLLTAFQKARREMVQGRDLGRFGMAFLVAVIFYSWTEVPFRATNPIWFLFFLIMMDYPTPQRVTPEPLLADDFREEPLTFKSGQKPAGPKVGSY
jgi:O-antigen ligase